MNFICSLKRITIICSIATLASCTTGLTKEGTQVELSLEAPTQKCKKVDIVHYSYMKGTSFGCDFLAVKNVLRNETAKAGGNYVKMSQIDDAGVYCNATGEAYLCTSN